MAVVGLIDVALITSLVVLLMTTTTVLASSVSPPIAKDGCEAQCGNVNIPYPFGFGPNNCYLNKWFEIVCNKSTAPHTPFLKSINQEVLNITLRGAGRRSYQLYEHWVQVSNPISFFNCPGKKTRQPVNLTGSPFYYSSTNEFVAVSCGIFARVSESESSSSPNLFSVGCESMCSSTPNTTSSQGSNNNYHRCHGTDCCQISIPSELYAPNISLDNSASTAAARDHDDDCKFAFMVDDEYWYDYKNSSKNFKTIPDMDNVPITLSWNMNYSYYSFLSETNNTLPTPSSKYPGRRSFFCYISRNNDDNESSSSLSDYRDDDESSSSLSDYFDDYDGANITSQTLITSCYCYGGFRGNPYLKDGCEDINECEEYKYNRCGDGYGSTCTNTYGYYECSYRQKSILIGIGSAIGALVLLFGTWGLYKVIKKRKDIKRKRKFFKRNGGLLLQQQISANEGKLEKKLFSSNVLKKATDNFSKDRILGQGGQGTVYKGMLEDGKIVAIKRSKTIDDEAQLSEFINEVVILSQINHRNVVQLLGCCLETEVPLLVYEFIPNGTLSAYIHERNEEFSFTWKMRLGIAAEVAGALSYLHSAASFPIYHRDIKSTNILLDEKYRAKVADFGTSRTISLEQTHVTTLVYGTFGYLDPEYFQSGQFTDKSDVYSFGVVLVELLTGQRAVSIARSEEGRNLATYFSMSMDDHESLCNIVDAQVIEDAPKEEIIIVANLAHRCLNLNGRNRPTMKEVATELEGIQKPRTTTSKSQQNYDEVEYVRTELIEPWDSGSTSTISALGNTTTRTSFRQELPLLSFGSC